MTPKTKLIHCAPSPKNTENEPLERNCNIFSAKTEGEPDYLYVFLEI